MKKALTFVLSLIILTGCSSSVSNGFEASDVVSPVTQELRESSAVSAIEARLAELDNILYVYKDASNGHNNFTQKAFMGSSYHNAPPMSETAEGFSGISGISAELNLRTHSWGGYMFINGKLLPGGVPELSFGEADAALDLTGAEKLVFYARGEAGGERIEFFMGGLGWNGNQRTAEFADSTAKISLGTVELSTEWQRYEIDVSNVDLSGVGCGFGWVANNRSNSGQIKFYMDEIHYIFTEPRLTPQFLQSYGSAAPGTDDAIINNFSYLYDNCIAAMALSYAGKHDRARQIGDAIVYALNNDRHYSDGRLRNAYMSGNPQSPSGWYSAVGSEFARIPGFYENGMWYEDFYAVSVSTGNLAWAILALCELYRNNPERPDYLDSARKIADFILTLQSGLGFTGGYEGWEGSEARVGYKSTEHNIDLITAFAQLERLTGNAAYGKASDNAREFVMSMFDEEQGFFYTGTAPDGVTVNKDVLPLDCQTWALLVLGKDFGHTGKVVESIEKHFTVDGGYDFNNDKDGIWFEGTAQVALVYYMIGDMEKYTQILAFMQEHTGADGFLTAADRDGVSTGFDVAGTNIPWNYNKREHIGATAWLAFAEMGINPLAI